MIYAKFVGGPIDGREEVIGRLMHEYHHLTRIECDDHEPRKRTAVYVLDDLLHGVVDNAVYRFDRYE